MNYKLNFKSYVIFMIFDYIMLYVYGTINFTRHVVELVPFSSLRSSYCKPSRSTIDCLVQLV
jgi:hypothetical protein